MCETCANKLLELAEAAMPLPDQMGDGRAANTLRDAAKTIRPIENLALRQLANSTLPNELVGIRLREIFGNGA